MIIIIIIIFFVLVKNPCLPNPCKNGGKCNRKGSSYSCSCAKGYAGKRCESKFNVKIMLDYLYNMSMIELQSHLIDLIMVCRNIHLSNHLVHCTL